MTDHKAEHAAASARRTGDALPEGLEFPRYVFKPGGALLRVDTAADARHALASGWSLDPNVGA